MATDTVPCNAQRRFIYSSVGTLEHPLSSGPWPDEVKASQQRLSESTIRGVRARVNPRLFSYGKGTFFANMPEIGRVRINVTYRSEAATRCKEHACGATSAGLALLARA